MWDRGDPKVVKKGRYWSSEIFSCFKRVSFGRRKGRNFTFSVKFTGSEDSGRGKELEMGNGSGGANVMCVHVCICVCLCTCVHSCVCVCVCVHCVSMCAVVCSGVVTGWEMLLKECVHVPTSSSSWNKEQTYSLVTPGEGKWLGPSGHGVAYLSVDCPRDCVRRGQREESDEGLRSCGSPPGETSMDRLRVTAPVPAWGPAATEGGTFAQPRNWKLPQRRQALVFAPWPGLAGLHDILPICLHRQSFPTGTVELHFLSVTSSQFEFA